MSISLAGNNVFQNKKRMLAAVSGITFSLLLVFMQVGFLQGTQSAAIALFECFNFDLAIVSDKYQFVGATGTFDRIRLTQAQSVPEVDATTGLRLEWGEWEVPNTKMICQILLFGIELDPGFIKDPMILSGLNTLDRHNAIMLDLYSHRDYGDTSLGREVKINGIDVTIASYFKLGVTIIYEGSAMVSDDTFSRLTRVNPRTVNYGFIRIKPGADPGAVRLALEAVLPSDILVLERAKMLRQEQDYFISVKPVGIIFQVGVFTAFLVGVVILSQILATDITKRLNEYATLKAMGFNIWFIYSICIKQAVIYAFLSFPPSAFFAFCVFRVVHSLSRMPMNFTCSLVLFVYFTTLLMCVISCALALQKIRKTDPAELL